jgi:hypothetical protein
LEYSVCVWLGRWAEVDEIAQRLRLPEGEVAWLIRSAMQVEGCRNVADLRAKARVVYAEKRRADWRRALKKGE